MLSVHGLDGIRSKTTVNSKSHKSESHYWDSCGIAKAMGKYEELRNWLRKQAGGQGISQEFVSRLGTSKATAHRVLNQENDTKASSFLDWLDRMGVKFVLPDDAPPETVKSVCFVSPNITGVDPYVSMQHNARVEPDEDNFLAIPIVNRVGAGGGYMDEKEVRDWMIAYRPALPQPVSSNLVAVTVAKDQYSMVPLIFPGDILLVDKNDCEPKPPGSIMLVIEPEPERGERIKRVATKRRDGDMEITFYSQDAERYPPDTYYLNRDYGGDIRNAIGGRVLWGWTDITRR